jgi:hypothetical protein
VAALLETVKARGFDARTDVLDGAYCHGQVYEERDPRRVNSTTVCMTPRPGRSVRPSRRRTSVGRGG